MDFIAPYLGTLVVAAPALLVLLIGATTLFDYPLAERRLTGCIQFAIVTGLIAALAMLFLMLTTGTRHVPIELGNWVSIPHYHFNIKFIFDRLSVPFVILTFLLCGTVGAFAANYMHREPGFTRFHICYSLFVLGMVTTSLAGTIETLFAGWEFVGLSSALLVAFFHERPSPVRNGLRVWAVYRVSDAALLMAAVVMHHLRGHGDFDQLLGNASWPEGVSHIESGATLAVGSLLLLAAAGKSALVPFSSWLPRAMEGPTPSSAVFYGALSVHLGAFLLLRFSPLLDASPTLRLGVIAIGLVTAVFAAVTARVQSDIKSALSYASLTQVGLIVLEIGLGLRYLALIHILGHGCVRTLQFLRAPALLQDYRTLENAIGQKLPSRSSGVREWAYRFALERGYLDVILDEYIARPVLWFFTTSDRLERRYVTWLSGDVPQQSPKSDDSALED